ncbi:hypothetical protein GQ55_4G131700 [Panicum hallii var. hallii]|uniref:Uncharacterized protein n=2 Tax=Panicum hallii TaxID=206008 RepID=A0A2T7DY33_9POAL|nr:hypothetical protein GQ55_4G131700 [Panicum hallii var. hallii]PVH47729.1 hypothetical protein PAHAL_4G132700 [Panicum hallii]
MHLFFSCSFSQACWGFISIPWDFNSSPLDMIIFARQQFGKPIFRKVVMVA